MSHTRVGIVGGGWPGVAHAKGYLTAGGFSVVAVADLIPDRRAKLAADWPKAKQYSDAAELLADPDVEAVSICLPTHLHLSTTQAVMKAGKHVLLETPPGVSVREARQLAGVAAKRGKVLAYAFQRRFGGAELAAAQAIEKGYAGQAYHARATWMRTRGIPIGTGWYTDKDKSGGGALLDLGGHMLDTAWFLLGRPNPVSVYAVTRRQFREQAPIDMPFDVEDAAFAIVKFDHGKSLELSVSWAINQAPAQNGTTCRGLRHHRRRRGLHPRRPDPVPALQQQRGSQGNPAEATQSHRSRGDAATVQRSDPRQSPRRDGTGSGDCSDADDRSVVSECGDREERGGTVRGDRGGGES